MSRGKNLCEFARVCSGTHFPSALQAVLFAYTQDCLLQRLDNSEQGASPCTQGKHRVCAVAGLWRKGVPCTGCKWRECQSLPQSLMR